MKHDQGKDTSPESRIVPNESMDEAQLKISGEKFPGLVLEVCDNCCWCLTCFNKRGIIKSCPICKHALSLIPMTIEEISSVEFDREKGLSIHFSRRHPVR